MKDLTVVVLGRNYTSRLGMIRAAGLAGYKVIVINTDKSKKSSKSTGTIDSYSKYVDKCFHVKEPNTNELIKLLLTEIKQNDSKVILLPTDDYTASVIDNHIDILKEGFVFPNINYEQGRVVHFMDKSVQKTIAKRIGLNVAQGWTAVCKNDNYVIPEDVIYPCFIKPEVSFMGNKHFMQKCNNREHLQGILDDLSKKIKSPVLIEQFISIKKEYAILGIANKEYVEIPALIAIDSMNLGVAATATVTPMKEYDELREKLRQYIASFQFTGLFDIDLYEDDNGVIYFNELNLRFGASGYAITRMVDNLPRKLIMILSGETTNETNNPDVFAPFSFASEKVCFQRYLSKSITWQEYKRIIAQADCTFVVHPDDPIPGRKLKWYTFVRHVVREAKRLIGK